ncbi:hypothetical protein GQ54DRAFT_40541 [Martensiomyces pterosporus]|nr:hypothetical protein GQ54DRAFT_40541 [Martensiomyces pterosporus]
MDAAHADLVDWSALEPWLRQLYAPSLPPAVSRDADTQHKLSQLYAIDKPASHIKKTVAKVQREASDEYESLSAQVCGILEAAGLPPSSLPPSTSKALSDLSKLAADLNAPNMREETFEQAVSLETMAGFKRQTQLESAKRQIAETNQRIRQSQERQRHLRRLLEERQAAAPVEAQKTREWIRNSEIIAQKAGEYKERLAELEAASQKHRVRERGLEYAQIKELDTAVNELRKTVEEKQAIYDGYAALPPDISLAWLKLEEAKQKLEQLRIECENTIAAAFSTEK